MIQSHWNSAHGLLGGRVATNWGHNVNDLQHMLSGVVTLRLTSGNIIKHTLCDLQLTYHHNLYANFGESNKK